MELRKEIFKKAIKKLRKNKKFAKVIHNWLVSFDARQSPTEFDTGNEEQEISKTFFSISSKKRF